MIGFVLFWVVVGVVAVALISCAGPSPSRLEMDYGTSAKLAVVNQTLNPEASKNLGPVTGMDGEAAEGIMERYREGFEKPTPPTTYSFTIGNIGK
ncbi:MAG: hypothetical protein A2170_03985 [Deltaproteobacteria bacterium RBG_13_53_10]|nr:MAG: hypothetical protein A2170_03985 [Deltaproteobacteria bacterium RBG_13_53_10]